MPEAPGNLPDANAYHSRADIANIAIGQGEILATPVQVADITATVANGGIKNRINIVDAIVDENGRIVKKIKVSEGRRIISKETSDRIREMMEEVTISGTGTEAVTGYYGGAGGKTGSAETGSRVSCMPGSQDIFPRPSPYESLFSRRTAALAADRPHRFLRKSRGPCLKKATSALYGQDPCCPRCRQPVNSRETG